MYQQILKYAKIFICLAQSTQVLTIMFNAYKRTLNCKHYIPYRQNINF
jgi:hypothetical protein